MVKLMHRSSEAEQVAVNHLVVGSIPTDAAKIYKEKYEN